MTITVVCDVLGKENNGTTTAAMNLIRYLRSQGHEVRVICPDAERKGEEGYYVVPKIHFRIFKSYVEKNGVCIAKPDKTVIRSAIEGADVVHVMVPFFIGHYACKVATELGIPVTAGFHCQAENVTSHLFLMNSGIANRAAYRAFYKILYQYCDCIHYPTQFICDTFESRVGPTNHYIISNGVGDTFRRMSGVCKPAGLEDKTVILFTGRYSKEKSHKVLIDGVSRSKYRDSIQLIFAGDGPQKDALKKYAAKRLSIQPVFKFFSRDELIKVINYADLYVHPAEVEIEAISCVEAISCGKTPVISNSPRSATKSFALSDKNLFRCNDPDDLAAKIDYWIEHPAERKECGDMYLAYAGQFRFDDCMKKMESMLSDAVRMKKHG